MYVVHEREIMRKSNFVFLFCLRKNLEDFTGPRERSDLGFVTFDITADILNGKSGLKTF